LGQGNSSSPSSPSSQLLTTPALLGGDAAWRPPPPLAFRDGSIVDALAGTPLDLHGFNWAGFNYIQYGMEFFEGLQEGGETATGDFATVVYRQQLLGFNLVRIPFRFASLFEEEEGGDKEAAYGGGRDGGGGEGGEARAGERLLARKRWRRPSRTLARRCRWTSRAALKKVLTNPSAPFYSRIDYDAIRLPKPVAPPAKPASYATRRDANGRGAGFKNPPECNWYLPDTSILDRMLFAVQYYVANGEEGCFSDWIGGGGAREKRDQKGGREGKGHDGKNTGKSPREKSRRRENKLTFKPLPLPSQPKQNKTTFRLLRHPRLAPRRRARDRSAAGLVPRLPRARLGERLEGPLGRAGLAPGLARREAAGEGAARADQRAGPARDGVERR
jgi:hypothetical protein